MHYSSKSDHICQQGEVQKQRGGNYLRQVRRLESVYEIRRVEFGLAFHVRY